jgi:hypothetical protein
MRTSALLLLALLLAGDSAPAQEGVPSAERRRAGAADLDAWSRKTWGEAGTFTNPDTSGWIPYLPQPSDVDAGGILDAGHLVEAPSGTHGFPRDDGKGGFVFEDGTLARFLGGQIDPFPEKSHAEWLVRWMRRHGLNYARAHGFGRPTAEQWDRLDYLIARCKEAGIYVVLTPVYWTEFEVVDPEGHPVKTSSHVVLFFNANMEGAVRELWRTFYTHENPYTGLRYADDPTLAAFELKNEDSAFWALSWIREGLPVFWAEIRRQYAAFLKERYGSTEGLRRAWTLPGYPSALREGESLEDATVEIFEMAGWHVEKGTADIAMRPRKSDQTRFLHEKQKAFYERSVRYLRDLGCRQAIAGSNWRGHSYTMRHVLELDSRMGYVDQHDYFDHPQGGWRTDVAVQHNRSMLKDPAGGLLGNLAPRQVLDRPYTVSEWNIGTWNEHVLEASFTMVPYAMLQGWDGLVQFVLLPRETIDRSTALSPDFFSVGQNPSVSLQYPTLARMWHRGDVSESEPVFVRRISPSDLHRPEALPSRYLPEAFMLTFGEEIPGDDEYGHLLAAVGKVGNVFVDEPTPHLEREGLRSLLDREGRVARSVTGELTWSWGEGYVVVDTPRTQAVGGYVGGVPIRTRDAVFEVETPYGAVFVTSVEDEAPVASSRRLLVTALGRARNTGTRYGNAADRAETADRHASEIRLPPAQRVAVLEVGGPPILTEPIVGRVSLQIDHPGVAKAWVLDDRGGRRERLETAVEGGRLVLDLPGLHRSRFVEVVLP